MQGRVRVINCEWNSLDIVSGAMESVRFVISGCMFVYVVGRGLYGVRQRTGWFWSAWDRIRGLNYQVFKNLVWNSRLCGVLTTMLSAGMLVIGPLLEFTSLRDFYVMLISLPFFAAFYWFSISMVTWGWRTKLGDGA